MGLYSPEEDHVQEVERARQPDDHDNEDALDELPLPEVPDGTEDLLLGLEDGLELDHVGDLADLAGVDADPPLGAAGRVVLHCDNFVSGSH